MGKALLSVILLLLAIMVLLPGCCRFVNPNLPLNTSSPFRNASGPNFVPVSSTPGQNATPENIFTANQTVAPLPDSFLNPGNATPGAQGGEFNASGQNFAAAGNEGGMANASNGQNNPDQGSNGTANGNLPQGQNGSPIHDDAYWNQEIGMGGTRAEWAESVAENDFSNAVCNILPTHAMRIVNFPAPAVFIPGNMSDKLAGMNDSFTFVSPSAFVGSPQDPHMGVFIHADPSSEDPTKDRFYWNCWTVGSDGETRVCLIPITATLNAANGPVTKTGAIKLSFTGPVMPFTSACNWTPPAVSSVSGYSCPTTGGAPCMAPSIDPDSIPPNTPECTNPPAPSGTGAESGPHDVISMPHPTADHTPPAPADNKPGPRINTPTFNRTGCEVNFDPTCKPHPNQTLCGQCSYGSVLSVITYDQWHTDPSGHANNLGGSCQYCPSGDTCQPKDAYGNCGGMVCLKPTVPSAFAYWVGCTDCASGGVVSWRGDSQPTCAGEWQQCYLRGCSNKKSSPNCLTPAPAEPGGYSIGCSECPDGTSVSQNSLSYGACHSYYPYCQSIGCGKITSRPACN